MNFAAWEPVYGAILRDMGYDRAADEATRGALAACVGGADTVETGDHSFDGETVAIAAPGPPLDATSPVFREADTIVAAGVAADRLADGGLAVDWIVTDLDGHPERVGRFTAAGVPVAVHAHGDNRALVEEYVPTYELAAVLPTTQAAPAGPVRNFGGFTDGDRAAFLADALDAERLVFPGWDLADPTVGPEKRRKLRWAAHLLHWLERCRGDSFAVLDGLRDGLDLSMVPGEG